MNKAANGGGKKRFSRLLCLALVFLMLCSLAPVGAWAADDAGVPEDSVGAGSDSALNEPEPPAEEEPPAPTEEEPSAPTEEEPPAPTEEEPPAPTEEEPPAPAEEDPPAPAEDPAEDPKDELPPDNGETPTGDNLLPIEEAEEKGEDEEAEDAAFQAAETTVSLIADNYRPPLHFEARTNGVTVIVDAPEETLPFGTAMRVAPVRDQGILQTIGDEVGADASQVTAVDISFWFEDEEIEPESYIFVTLKAEVIVEAEDTQVVHMDSYGATQVVQQIENYASDEVSFVAEDFSVYAIVGTTIEKKILASDGHNYKISVTYGADAGIPEGAALEVSELLPDGEEYARYLAETAAALGCEAGTVSYARLFDIDIVDENGGELQPAQGAAVDVKVTLADAESEGLSVVHFGAQTEVLEAEQTAAETGYELSFSAASFSVYAIVDAPEPVDTEIQTVNDLSELTEGEAFYLSYGDPPKYFSNQLNSKGAFLEASDPSGAAEWFFEPTGSGTAGEYYLYTYVSGEKQYLRNTSGNLVGLGADNAAALTLSAAETGKFFFKKTGENKWLQHSNGGEGIRFYTSNSDAVNTRISITYAASFTTEDDPYELDGKTFGIAYNDESATAVALTAEAKSGAAEQRLAGLDLLIRPDVLNNEGLLLVAENSDLVEWTFESVAADTYYLKTTVDGAVKYLSIDGQNVMLLEEPDPAKSVITAVPGTGENSGKWHFAANGYSLNLAGSAGDGFNASAGTDDTVWMNLVRKSVLNDDDFVLYTAKKVSVSDTVNVYDGQRLVLYTRIWNDSTKRYEFYAVDHNGSLVRCYDTGDNIQWIGSQVNTALWEFTEYLNDDGTPSYYYELQNTQYGDYIAPQVTGGQILSDKTIGVNLNGRRYGESYTTIVAWDDKNYAYVGLKTEDGHIVACPLSEAEDFYFAVVNPVDTNDKLTEVATVDSNAYGITMKMFDFNNKVSGERDSGQAGFMGAVTGKGLLSTNLGEDGYPTGTSKTAGGNGQSFANLIGTSDGEVPVNHLFLESIYNESGYFEYDSTQNFAHLNDDGTFTVYDQIGAITGSSEDKNTRVHGQFMPYNDITAGVYAYDRNNNLITNRTDVLGNELPDTDPRKGETLYRIGSTSDVDYFFGMEMEASFTQTASGLDAWGHDIIFEFSGDDDFWLYVDGELVLDLGGVHVAQVGSVNFRTGVITSSNGNSTLYETFKKNYQTRGMTTAEINAKLAEIFVKNAEGNYVFKDYTNHTMKMLYMERGAGASNLHMRFNLAAVKPGTFLLSKKLSGTEQADNDLIEFPYQIWYTTQEDGEAAYHLLDNSYSVVYAGTTTAVRYEPVFTPAGGTEAYDNVFFLKPGETAEVTLPEKVVNYYVVECGVNPDIYDKVTANEEELTGVPTANLVSGTAREDYATRADSLKNRAEVEFDNHVQEGAMRILRLQKLLFDVDGVAELHYPDDDTVFSFRLYLGDENADPDALPLANMYDYCVLAPDGSYCRWDADNQRFVSLGKTLYSQLTAEEKEAATFQTSMNGAISKIPADHTVEVRNLIIGTQYKVEERAWEIPRGYTLRAGDGYTRVDLTPEEPAGDTPYTGVMARDEEPKIQVRNQKGWGLTLEKNWTDRDFMTSHDDIFFAVYLKTDSGEQLYDGSVRRLKSPETEVYYFFDDLTYNDYTYTFADFVLREVALTGAYTVDEDGKVTGYDTITPVTEGGTLLVGGTPTRGQHQDGFSYKAEYAVGASTGHNENVRTDTVTNTRPGIALYKTDWSGAALSGAVFTLTDAEGNDVAAESYTSDSEGLITIAYLGAGTFTLTETATPDGYVALPEAMTLTVGAGNSVTVSGPEGYYTVELGGDGDDMIATVTIKNHATDLSVKKVDAVTGQPIKDVHFALYLQVTGSDGKPRKDYLPMAGFEDVASVANGVLPGITGALGAGTYYLVELAAPEGYDPLAEDLCFTIEVDGTVTIHNEAYASWLTTEPDGDSLNSIIAIRNQPNTLADLVLEKQVTGNMGDRNKLFTFRVELQAGGAALELPGITDTEIQLKSGQSRTLSGLPAGATVILTETDSGDYLVSAAGVIGAGDGESETAIPDRDTADSVFAFALPAEGATVTFTNHKDVTVDVGVALDALPFVLGLCLCAAGAAALLLRRRRREG